MNTLAIDTARLTAELEQLALFSDAPAPAVTRVLFTPPDRDARVFLRSLFEDAGLTVHQDAAGTLLARWQGTDADAPAVATGSHTDAIPLSGRFDGTVGVLGGLEAFRALRRAGFCPRRSLELVMFTSEEPTRFGLGCLSSRLMSGARAPADLANLQDADGQAFDDVRRAAGCSGTLADAVLARGHYAAFVELHIEQGPLLEAGSVDIGIVSAIAAPATLRVELHGVGGHAGGTLMPGRRDALCAAAALALAVEAAALGTGCPDTVATTGRFEIRPGAVNSIPDYVLMEIDVRDIDAARRDSVVREIETAARRIGAERGVTVHCETLNADPPAACSPLITDAIQTACAHLNLLSQAMVSRAYHDSLFMARIAPTGMVFIPCRGGVSHRPDEYSTPEQIAAGVHVLALTLASLAGEDA